MKKINLSYRPTLLQASIFVNLVTIGLLVYLWRKPTPPIDRSLHDLAMKNNETLLDLGRQIKSFNDERAKAIDEYQVAIKASLVDHDKRLGELEKKKTADAKKILGTYDGNLPGLAKDFSATMGLGSN